MIKLLAIKHIELRYFLPVLFVFIAMQEIVYAQLPQKKAVYKGFPSLVWPKLYDITYIKEAEDFGGLDKPIFSDAAKSLQGKEITVPGYMVPFDNGAMTANHFYVILFTN